MDFATLPQSLDSFLDSLIPALSHCVFVVLYLWFMLGSAALLAPLGRFAAMLRAPDTLTQDPFVKESGLLKLVPFTLLVVALLAVVAIDRTVLFVGDKLPGRISIRQPELFAHSVPETQLAQLWSLNPAASNLGTLQQMLDYQAMNVSVPSGRSLRLPWERHDADFVSAQNQFEAAKFYAAFGLLLCLSSRRMGLSPRRTWGRYAVVLAGAIAFAALSVHQHVRAKKQSDRAKVVYVVHARMVADANAAVAINDVARQAAFEARVKAFKAQAKRRAYAIES